MKRRQRINRKLCEILTDAMVADRCIADTVQRWYCVCGENPEAKHEDYSAEEMAKALVTIDFIRRAVKEKLETPTPALSTQHSMPGGTGI
jgi:Lon protease-like protein